MTTYAANELSVQNGSLREIYSFTLASGNYQLTTHDRDILYNAVTYTKTPGLSRGPITRSPMTERREMVITLPRNHPIAGALMPSPPRLAQVSIVRIYADSTSASTDRRQVWFGSIIAASQDHEYVRLRVPGAIDVAFDIDVPILRVSRTCQHQLYSAGCQTARSAALRKLPTATVINGALLTVSSLAPWTTQANLGEVVRLSDGERRSVLNQTGNVLLLDVPFGTLNVTDPLEVWRGCDKTLTTCSAEFLNINNFGGHPTIPGLNPGSPTGRGLR